MKLDFTKEVELNKEGEKKYKRKRWLIFIGALALIFYYAFVILFPSKEFKFDFGDPTALSNNIQISKNDEPVNLEELEEISSQERGKIAPADDFKFFASLNGRFSKVNLEIKIPKDTTSLEGNEIEIKKSYQAFFYPEGEPFGFRNGSLIKNGNEYFIVSQGKLRKFQSVDILEKLNYPINYFWEVSQEDLGYNIPGDVISDNDDYPSDTIFEIDEKKYLLSENKLKPFISQEAFLTWYDPDWTIEANDNIFQSFEKSEERIGFNDGSLIADQGSVFIISGNKAFPIGSPEIFEAKGYLWEDVIEAKNKESEMYQKTDIFYLSHPHPNGTVFSTTDTKKAYIIENGEKHLLPSSKIAYSWFKKNPIKISAESLEESIYCQLEGKKSNPNVYFCSSDIANLVDLEGKEYRFSPGFENEIQAEEINLDFKRSVDWPNFKFAVKDILRKLILKYATKE